MSNETNEGVDEQLARLKHLTKMTGFIHEAQLLQLKVWPRLLFPCDEHTISHDSKDRTVEFTLKLNGEMPEGEDLAKRISTLEQWCWSLLGPEWSIRLSVKKGKGRPKKLHQGRRNAELPVEPEPVMEYGVPVEFKRYSSLDKNAAWQSIADVDLKPIGGK